MKSFAFMKIKTVQASKLPLKLVDPPSCPSTDRCDEDTELWGLTATIDIREDQIPVHHNYPRRETCSAVACRPWRISWSEYRLVLECPRLYRWRPKLKNTTNRMKVHHLQVEDSRFSFEDFNGLAQDCQNLKRQGRVSSSWKTHHFRTVLYHRRRLRVGEDVTRTTISLSRQAELPPGGAYQILNFFVEIERIAGNLGSWLFFLFLVQWARHRLGWFHHLDTATLQILATKSLSPGIKH